MPSSTSPRGVDASDGSGILGFTSALRSQLAGSQSKFDSWVEGQKARADEAAAAHAELVEARRLEIRSLEAELRMIGKSRSSLDLRIERPRLPPAPVAEAAG